MQLRSKTSEETIPITTRQLMSIIRLAEASAKVRLSPVVTEDDVNLAKELLFYSLREVGINPETQKLDIDIIMTGISTTQRQKLSKILDIIKDLQKDFPDGVPLNEIINESKKYIENYRYSEYVKIWRKFVWEDFANNYLEKIKERIKNNDLTAKWVLYNIYKIILAYLHPILPYVTEYIYQKLYGEKETILEEKFEDLFKTFS